MTLLERGKNNDLGNVTFSEKKETYKKSSIPSTKEIGETIDDWNENEIDSRQRKMARMAKGIWRIQE